MRVRDLSRTEHDARLALIRSKLRGEFNFPKNRQRYFGVPAVYSLENVKYPQADGSVCGLRPQLGEDAALRLDCGAGLGLGGKLLWQAARENPRVLKEPAPIVYFLTFGESTLDHELRMHVRDLGDRNPVLDEINRFINKEFKKQHINISFRQMEVYLKNMQGQEYKMVPVEPEQKTLAAPAPTTVVPAAPKDVPEPPEAKLD